MWHSCKDCTHFKHCKRMVDERYPSEVYYEGYCDLSKEWLTAEDIFCIGGWENDFWDTVKCHHWEYNGDQKARQEDCGDQVAETGSIS